MPPRALGDIEGDGDGAAGPVDELRVLDPDLVPEGVERLGNLARHEVEHHGDAPDRDQSLVVNGHAQEQKRGSDCVQLPAQSFRISPAPES